MGRLQLPQGKKIAVNLGVDVDAQSLWLGGFNRPSPSFMSRGQFGAEVGMPRILNLFKKYQITSTFFTPAHTLDTFPNIIRRAMEEGHEIANHGYYHENPTLIDRDTEARLLDLAIASFKNQLGIRAEGYRSPYWDYSDNTLDLIEERGYFYDSSLMARDLELYRPQKWQVNWETPNVAGPASSVLEIPVSWYLDDFPALAYTGNQEGMNDTDAVFRRWRDIFDYAYHHVENGVYAMALHPQIIGQPHHMLLLERLIQHILSYDGIWFASCIDIAKTWVDDESDLAKMRLPKLGAGSGMPSDYHWK